MLAVSVFELTMCPFNSYSTFEVREVRFFVKHRAERSA